MKNKMFVLKNKIIFLFGTIFVSLAVVVIFLILTLTNLGRFKDMATLYESAIKISPENPRTRYNYGLINLARGDYEVALKEFKKVLELNSLYNVKEVWKMIGKCYDEIGYIGEAKSYYIKTLFLGDDKEVLMKLATIYWYEGKTKTVKWLLEKSLEIEPDAVSYNNLGLCYLKEKNFNKAIENFNLAINLFVGYTDAWINLINAYDTVGDKVMVEKVTSRMVEIYYKNGWSVE
jgi:tetratricopeptide (TPR) repeat protein